MSNFIIILITFILLTSFVEANDVKIIELHKSKSLDQLVLETKENEDENQNNLFTIEDNSDENNSSQIEIDLVTKNDSGLLDAEIKLKNVNDIGFIYLSDKDVIRHELVRKIINSYEKMND